jgi:hypothetical protein
VILAPFSPHVIYSLLQLLLTPQEYWTDPVISKTYLSYVTLKPSAGLEMTLGVESKALPHSNNLKRRVIVSQSAASENAVFFSTYFL